MNFQIIDPRLSFPRQRERRTRTNAIVIHHLHGDQSVQEVHRMHTQNNGWNGIGYNYHIAQDGTISLGRGMEFVGAHTGHPLGTNSSTIGIGCAGRFHDRDRTMPDAQFNALVWLCRHLQGIYGNIPIRGHRDYMATACPGQFFPMDEVRTLQFRGEQNIESDGEEIAPRLYWVTTQSSPLNVRSGPGADQRLLGTIARGTLVIATRQADGWLYVTDNKISGWVSAQFLTRDPFPFVDVHPSAWYYCTVRAAWENDIIQGTTETTFDPNGTLTRAMAVTLLWRLAGEPEVEFEPTFSDVREAHWFADAVLWGSSLDIVKGVGDGRFAPNEPITREEFAVFIYRYASSVGLEMEISEDFVLDFVDNDLIRPWAIEAMHWAVSRGIIQGAAGLRLQPRESATRAEAVTMLQRFIILLQAKSEE